MFNRVQQCSNCECSIGTVKNEIKGQLLQMMAIILKHCFSYLQRLNMKIVKSVDVFFFQFSSPLFGSWTLRLTKNGSCYKFIHRFFEALKPVVSASVEETLIY